MLLAESMRYFILYSVISVTLLLWSLFNSLVVSVNLITFIIEFTKDYKLRILLNAIIFSFLFSNLVIQKLLFGELRLIEHEHLMRALPLFGMNLLLNLAINDVNSVFNCFLLGVCLSSKIYHILLTARLDQLHISLLNNYERSNYTRRDVLSAVIRSLYLSTMLVFILINYIFAKYLVYEVFQGINSIACVLYGFQFAVIGVDAFGYLLKFTAGIYEIVSYMIDSRPQYWDTISSERSISYEVNLADDEDEGFDKTWEAKPYFTKGIDIAISTLKALLHLWFIYILTFRSALALPFLMLQGTFSSLKQTYTEIMQLLVFIESSQRMDTQLRNASQHDLNLSDILCIICREDMCSAEKYLDIHKRPISPRKIPKKLWCNHILHLGCLKEWLERSDCCPLCRNKVFEQPLNKRQPENNAAARNEVAMPNDNTVVDENVVIEPNTRMQELAQLFDTPESTNEQSQTDISSIQRSNITQREDAPLATPTYPVENISGRRLQLLFPLLASAPPDWVVIPLNHASSNPLEQHEPKTYHAIISENLTASVKVIKKDPKQSVTLRSIN